MKILNNLLFAFFCLAVVLHPCTAMANTIKLPQWYKMTASLTNPPLINETLTLNVELSAIIGNLENVSLRLILPENWKVSSDTKNSQKIKAGESRVFSFEVTPKSILAQGSIVVEAVFDVPKSSICLAVDKMTTDRAIADGMKAQVNSWATSSKRYADVSFAMFPEESFYPISSDMWVDYADDMAPKNGFKGPSYFKNPALSSHQAQIDVEMFSKLNELLKTDPSLYENLSAKGIDLEKKRLNYLDGLYALALDAFKDENYQTALDLLERLDKETKNLKSGIAENLRISGANIKALVFWRQGQRRLAEDAFQKAFYQNRKHSLQRYILRNLGLLMFATGDKMSAQQMYRLAIGFKRGYWLLDRELSLIN